ncbi:MAG: hypothetical protein PUF72_08910 [Clostridiales bacterium]|nr:hypothetical protein [Clostridiales bacterium]
MPRLFFSVLALIFFFCPSAFALGFELCAPLDDCIMQYGLFDGENGVIYASSQNFQNCESLFVCLSDKGRLRCLVYDCTDGIMLTDELAFSGDITVSLGECSGHACIIADKTYILLDDHFFTTQKKSVKTKDIAAKKNGKINTFSNTPQKLNAFLNGMKKELLASYGLTDIKERLNPAKKQKIHDIISACADIMSYDFSDCNYDRLFTDILNTHDNFRILTDKDPNENLGADIGYGGIYRVSAGFIDEIADKYFGIIPEKPPVNALSERGFCYSDQTYYYTKKYKVPFSTDVGSFAAIYNMGYGVYYCVFEDIYREGEGIKPEYSYCFVKDYGTHMRLMKIGMGQTPPDEYTAKKYASSYDEKSVFQSNVHSVSYPLLYMGLAIIAAVSAFIFLHRRNEK